MIRRSGEWITFSCGLMCMAAVAVAPSAAQTFLASEQAVAVALDASPTRLLKNGSNGYAINVPPDTMRLVGILEMASPGADIDLHLRCGSDVTTSGTALVSDTFDTTDNGVAVAVLSRPKAGTCFAALDIRTKNTPLYGRLRLRTEAFPAGTRVEVPAISLIGLAGQPAGTTRPGVTGLGSFAAPLNSPIEVPLSLTPGEALGFRAAGSVGLQYLNGFFSYPPTGTATAVSVGASSGISGILGPSQALYGVFLGPTIDSRNAPGQLDVRGGGKELVRIQPELQQVFFVGDGLTGAGQPRRVIVPAGATRLFLGVGAESPQNTGTFTAVVTKAPVPENGPTNPVFVPGNALISLAGQPPGSSKTGTSGVGAFSVPLNSPVEVPLAVGPGQALQIRANGSVVAQLLNGSQSNGPEGSGIVRTTAAFGLSAFTGPDQSLLAVFLGPTVDSRTTPPALDFSGGARDTARLQPLLQQLFYVGSGITPGGQARVIVVPSGATRLVLGVNASNSNNVGGFVATVTPDSPDIPQITANSIVNGAGFGRSPLAAGGLTSIFGQNLGTLAIATTVPLPTQLGITTVYFDTTPAPLFAVSPTQINAQIPTEFWNHKSVMVTVFRDGIASLGTPLEISPVGPGIFTTTTGSVIVNARTGQLVTSDAPIERGDTLVIYASGLGATLNDPSAGGAASGEVLSPTLLPVQAVIQAGGQTKIVAAAFAGLAPGFVGVNQVNVQIPVDAPTGTVQLSLQINTLGQSAPVTLSIH
jgi:uncharacterized protein (TIGR03437 family)